MAMTNEKAWDYAIGVVQIDGIKPSDDFLKLVEKEKKGEMTGDDIRRVLYKKYKVKEDRKDD
ncbi:MAG: antitoxin VbhA family protein [Lachnospirales bacterium]